MADYRCPNCGKYQGHTYDCSTGGTAAVARYTLYTSILKSVRDYWVQQRLNGIPQSLDGVTKAIDEAWQDSYGPSPR